MTFRRMLGAVQRSERFRPKNPTKHRFAAGFNALGMGTPEFKPDRKIAPSPLKLCSPSQAALAVKTNDAASPGYAAWAELSAERSTRELHFRGRAMSHPGRQHFFHASAAGCPRLAASGRLPRKGPNVGRSSVQRPQER